MFFLQGNTKVEVLKNVHAVLFHTMNGWGLEKDKKAPQKHNKSSPYYFRSHRMIALCEKQTEIQSQH